MRSKAKSTAALVERVHLGARVEILGTCGSWTKVKFGSRTGYMMTKFLTAEEDQEPNEDLTLEERVTRLEKTSGYAGSIRWCGRLTVRLCGEICRAAFLISMGIEKLKIIL